MIFRLSKEKQGKELVEEAKRLGVVTEDIFPSREIGVSDIANAKLQERVRSAKNIKYAKLTWIIALISAVASIVSALAAWLAVSHN